MQNWANWYKILLVFWAIFALPGSVLGILYSWGDFEFPDELAGVILWLILALFALSPALLWPFRKRPELR